MNTDRLNQYASPYAAMGNNPVMQVDPDGGYSLFKGLLKWAGGFFSGSFERENRGSRKGEYYIQSTTGNGENITLEPGDIRTNQFLNEWLGFLDYTPIGRAASFLRDVTSEDAEDAVTASLMMQSYIAGGKLPLPAAKAVTNAGAMLGNFGIPKFYTYTKGGKSVFVSPHAMKHLEELGANRAKLGPNYLKLIADISKIFTFCN